MNIDEAYDALCRIEESFMFDDAKIHPVFLESVRMENKAEIKRIARMVRNELCRFSRSSAKGKGTTYTISTKLFGFVSALFLPIPGVAGLLARPALHIFHFGSIFADTWVIRPFFIAGGLFDSLDMVSWQTVCILKPPGRDALTVTLERLRREFSDILKDKYEFKIIRLNWILGAIGPKRTLDYQDLLKKPQFTDMYVLAIDERGAQLPEVVNIKAETKEELAYVRGLASANFSNKDSKSDSKKKDEE